MKVRFQISDLKRAAKVSVEGRIFDFGFWGDLGVDKRTWTGTAEPRLSAFNVEVLRVPFPA